MNLYRADVQYKIPWEPPNGRFYYCTHVHHFLSDNLTTFDTMRDSCMRVTAYSLNVNVRLDRLWIYNLTEDMLVQSSSAGWPANTLLPGDFGPLINTVYMGLYSGGKWVGYKRLRSPLRVGDMDRGMLTPDAYDYYDDQVASEYRSGAPFCNQNGVLIDDARISPYVHGWQLRHGTYRSERRRLS